jgi:putative addiction module component (TIGR02574 family)
MSTQLEELQRQVKSLAPNEKAALARLLIEDLDQTFDGDVEQLWINEAERRYQAYLKGDIKAQPGDEVMNRVRARLK